MGVLELTQLLPLEGLLCPLMKGPSHEDCLTPTLFSCRAWLRDYPPSAEPALSHLKLEPFPGPNTPRHLNPALLHQPPPYTFP